MTEEKNTENFAELWQYIKKHRPQIEKSLREHLPFAPPQVETQFNEAVEICFVFGRKAVASGFDFAWRGTFWRKGGNDDGGGGCG